MSSNPTLQHNFLDEIANSVFTKDPTGEQTRIETIFRERFSPENISAQNKDLKSYQNYTRFQNALAKDVIPRIYKAYELEINSDVKSLQEKDNINVERWTNNEKGKGEVWKEVFRWLWQYKFPRWELDHLFWEPLKQQVNDENWIKIRPETVRNWELLELPEPEPLPVGEPLFITIKLPPESPYLLLLHRGITQRCFLCPSYIFAPEYRADENVIRLPQSESYWYQQKKIGIRLTTPGTDGYIAIALKEALDFDWLKPTKQELIPNWTSDRMEQLLGWLRDNSSSWQGCYQEFKVVKR